jgi:hypothetical protein
MRPISLGGPRKYRLKPLGHLRNLMLAAAGTYRKTKEAVAITAGGTIGACH